jgi:hypothetical protein
MRRAAWAVGCVAIAVVIAVAFYAAFRVAQYRRLPHRGEMTAACQAGRVTADGAPTSAGTPRCQRYFAELDGIHRTAVTQTAISGLLAGFILLVLRFRVRQLAGPARPSDPP